MSKCNQRVGERETEMRDRETETEIERQMKLLHRESKHYNQDILMGFESLDPVFPRPNHAPSEKAMATHSSTLAWKIPWMEEPGRLQFMGLQRVGHD